MRGRRIAAWLALAIGLACWIVPAHARSPKDAIKHLPKLTHSSRFLVTQNDSAGGSTYYDNYYGDWAIDWRPPAVSLDPQGKIKYAVYYSTSLQDLINRVEHNSNDLRRDYFRVNLNLDDVRWLNAALTVEHSDTYKTRREWAAEHSVSTNLSWAPPGLPTLAYGYISKYSTRRTQDGQSSASEFELSQYIVDFKDDSGGYAQNFKYTSQNKRSRNYLPIGGTDENISRLNGERQFPLGAIGSLSLQYYYDQYARSDFGSPEASTTTTNQYRVSLGNRIPTLPLSYNYSYSDLQKEFPGGGSQSIATRSLDLAVTPPTPEGKSASIGYHDELRESVEPAKKISNAKQQLTWNFQTNKLTTGRFSYAQETDYDRLQQSILRKREGYDSSLNYQVPGNGGSFSGSVAQWLESKPQGNARNSNNNVNLSSNLRLGQQASIIFNLAQQYSDSGTGLPGASFDTTRSSVRYRIAWANNLALDATYQQQLRVQTDDNKTVTETIGVKFDYRNDANWAYTFSLNLGDTQDITRIQPDSRQYETQNVIEARITYSF